MKDVTAFTGHGGHGSFRGCTNCLETAQGLLPVKRFSLEKVQPRHSPHSEGGGGRGGCKKSPAFSKGKLCLFHVKMTTERMS